MILLDPRNQSCSAGRQTQGRLPSRTWKLRGVHCLAGDVVAVRDAALSRDEVRNAPASPSHPPISCQCLLPAKPSQKTTHLWESAIPHFPTVEETSGRAKDGFESKPSNEGHTPNNFMKGEHLMWILKHEQKFSKQKIEKRAGSKATDMAYSAKSKIFRVAVRSGYLSKATRNWGPA